MERFGIIVGIALCSVLANGCWRGITVPIAAVVLSVKGTVLFGNAERNRFEPVTTKSLIRGGDTVRSMEGASVDLLLIPGALAQLPGNSEIKIEQLIIVKDGNETSDGLRDRSARIRLQGGKIIVLFYGGDRPPSRFAVTTRDLTITGDSGSLFSVWTDGTKARVSCARKNVVASAGAQPSITASAGHFLRWPASNTKPLIAADDASAQIDVNDSLQAGEQLESEWSAWQDHRSLLIPTP